MNNKKQILNQKSSKVKKIKSKSEKNPSKAQKIIKIKIF